MRRQDHRPVTAAQYPITLIPYLTS